VRFAKEDGMATNQDALPSGGKGTRSKTCSIDLPDTFPTQIYDGVSTKVAWLTSQKDDATARLTKNVYPAFGSAWLGVAYRITAVVRYDVEFRKSIANNPGPAGEERFIQERALFGCFVSAVSCVECFFVAAYAVGAAFDSNSFPVANGTDLDKLYPRPVADAFANGFPLDAFTTEIAAVAASSDFWKIRTLREVLSHRGALLRSHRINLGTGTASASVATNPKALPRDFQYSTELNDDTTGVHAKWTLDTLNGLIGELSSFLDRHNV
jgi:hypothetical protein